MQTSAVLLLLVEDEALIAAAAEVALSDGGYRVEIAVDGTEAPEVIDRRAADFSGLITDIKWRAEPDGWAVARHARELNPRLAIVYMTADSAADWAANGVPNSVVLQKPFAPAQLVTAVSTLINEAGSQPC